MAEASPDRADAISGIVLAGGLGERMQRQEKALVEFSARPMISHVLDRFAPQVDELLINANRATERYAAFGHRVIPDRLAGQLGPLAGLHSGMCAARHDWVVTVPCDAPHLPRDLVIRLRQALQRAAAEVVIASSGGRRHPVFCLCRTSLRPRLEQFLQDGGRRFDDWCRALHAVEAPFDDQPEAFVNVNTLAELKLLQTPDR